MELFHSALVPFTTAIILMLMILLVELIGLVAGAGISDFVDGLLPDLDADLDAPDMPDAGGGWLASSLGWLSVGKVPILMLLVILLTSFGLGGLIVQMAAHATISTYLPAVLVVFPIGVAALFVTRYAGLGLARVLPKTETDAVSTDSFIGLIAEIIRGEAKIDTPAEAKLQDVKGKTHYILIEPEDVGTIFKAGETVLITDKKGAVFSAIANTHTVLSRA